MVGGGGQGAIAGAASGSVEREQAEEAEDEFEGRVAGEEWPGEDLEVVDRLSDEDEIGLEQRRETREGLAGDAEEFRDGYCPNGPRLQMRSRASDKSWT